MVLISCSAVCFSDFSSHSKLYLNHSHFGNEFSLGNYVVVRFVDRGFQLPFQIVQSLPGDELSRLHIPSLLWSVKQLCFSFQVDIAPLPFPLYTIPLAKRAVITVPRLFSNVSLPALRLKLNNQILCENQHITPSQSTGCMQELNKNTAYVVLKELSGYGEHAQVRSSPHMGMWRVTLRTQLFVEPEDIGFSESIPRNLTQMAYGDIHTTLRGYIRNRLGVWRKHQEENLARRYSVSSVLLVGRSGSAKSQMVQEEAAAASVSLLKICPSSLLDLEESRLMAILNSFFSSALIRQPCVLLIELLELFVDTKHSSVMTQVVNALRRFQGHSALDEPPSLSSKDCGALLSVVRQGSRVLVVGCTETVDGLDPSLVSAFEEKICVPSTLSSSCENMMMAKIQGSFAGSFGTYTSPGGGKEHELKKLHGLSMMDFVFQCQQVTKGHNGAIAFSEPLKQAVSPGATPYVLSQDSIIAGVQDILLIPRRFPTVFKEYNMAPPTGILLFGPSGTGKTLLVKSIVKQISGTFINIKISEVMSGSIGESSSAIRNSFLQAKKRSPAVVFIDEFQALFSSREAEKSGSSSDSLIFTLIGCLDDIVLWNSSAGPEFIVTVLAATNEPWAVDEILLRAGRFDKVLFVGPMSLAAREGLLVELMRGISDIPVDVNFAEIAQKAIGFTGADVNLLFQKACSLYSDQVVHDAQGSAASTEIIQPFDNRYFDRVLDSMTSSCSLKELDDYTSWGVEFQSRVW